MLYMTRPEQMLCHTLESIGFLVKPYHDRTVIDPLNCIYSQMQFKTRRLDFALPTAFIAIEVDGDYWHGSRQNSVTAIQLKRQMGDAMKKQDLFENGWKLLTVVASDMKRYTFIETFRNRLWNLMDLV